MAKIRVEDVRSILDRLHLLGDNKDNLNNIITMTQCIINEYYDDLQNEKIERERMDAFRFAPIATVIMRAISCAPTTVYRLSQNESIQGAISYYNGTHMHARTNVSGALQRLVHKGYVSYGTYTDDMTGHRYTAYSLTELGRKALAQHYPYPYLTNED